MSLTLALRRLLLLPSGSVELEVEIKLIHIELRLSALHKTLQSLEALCVIFNGLVGIHNERGACNQVLR